MLKVVSNSSPLIHLAKIRRLELLKSFYEKIFIPESVYRECVLEGGEREEVKLIEKAEWIKVIKVSNQKLVKLLCSNLDYGESEAIALADELNADLILLDDYDAREKARLLHLRVTGTAGILLKAKRDGKIASLKEELDKLKATSFRITDRLIDELLKEAGELL